ncbi:MAG: acylneuraminate cytidylyltransferase family protein [Anaerolineae bacterium]|nr:MAG: acylneuraminate cytidylyltransferase family protein [Anaerolineae bacterium]
MKSILGIIPARGHSKGVPRKNIRPLLAKPLLAYTVECARESGVFERLVLSTDSGEIAAVGTELGLEVPFLRPPDLAQDDTPMRPVVEHMLSSLEEQGWQTDIVVLLQPTSPLRQPRHIQEAVRLLQEWKCDSVVTVVEIPDRFAPQKALKLVDNRLQFFDPEGQRITRRQMLEPMYSRDGTVYAFWRNTLMEKHSLYGDDWRPLILPLRETLTIDTLDDWAEAEKRLQEMQS